MNIHLNTLVRLLRAALAIIPLSSAVIAQAAPTTTTSKVHRAVKHVAAKHPPVRRSPQARIVPSSRPQGGGLPDLTPEQMQDASNGMRRLSDSSDLADAGDADAARGDWPQASVHYKQALSLWPGNDNALYGLGKCADTAGDTATALSYYRKAIYTTNPRHYGLVPGDNYDTNDVVRLMEFVLLLSKAGQKQEALAVYHRAAYLLNYRDNRFNGGKPYLKVLLPTFDSSPDAAVYTPPRLQALARVAIAYETVSSDEKAALANLQEAVKLYPDSPIPYYYLGRHLDLSQRKGAKEAYAKAAALGDDKIGAAAQEALKDLR